MGPAVDRLSRRIQRLTRLAESLQDLAVDLATELSIVRRTIAADRSGRLNAVVECTLLRAAHARHQAELEAATRGAERIEWRWQPSGAALVRVDEGKWFRLSRADARLLGILTRATRAGDGFPAWQTRQAVKEEIARNAGAPPTRHALTESVYRLRKAFKAADLNPFLIQVDRTGERLRVLLRVPPNGDTSVAAPVVDR